MHLNFYSLYLNEFRRNLTANLGRSPLIHSCDYESAGDQPTLLAIFPLIYVPSCNMRASRYSQSTTVLQ